MCDRIECQCQAPSTCPDKALRHHLKALGVYAVVNEAYEKGKFPNAEYRCRLIPEDFTLEQLRILAHRMNAEEQVIEPHALGGWFFYLCCKTCPTRLVEQRVFLCETCESAQRIVPEAMST